MSDLAQPDREEFASPKGGINAQGKQTEIAGLIAQNSLDMVDRSFGADRFDFDPRSRLRAIRVLTFAQGHIGRAPNH